MAGLVRGITRRQLILAAVGGAAATRAGAQAPFRFGLTPVFLDNDAEVVLRLRSALSESVGREIEMVQRRTYQEVTGLLLEGSVDAAWLCGYPFVQHEDQLELLAVPVWRGKPLYQSYLIVRPDDAAQGLRDLRGGIHAFSDPDSNSGYLVTATDLVRMGEKADAFFSRTLFTYGHRNVVKAVARGLARSGSVDGYVWEALAVVEPELTLGTKVIAKSEFLGFPPFVARRDRSADADVARFRQALIGLKAAPLGQVALRLLQLDGAIEGDTSLFDGIRARMRDLSAGQ